MKRVAIVVWDLSVSGGTQRQALELAQELKRRGVSVTIYTNQLDRKLCYPDLLEGLEINFPDTPAKKIDSQFGLQLAKLPFLGKKLGGFFEELYWSYRAQDHDIQQLASLMSDSHYEIINAHDSPAHKVVVSYKQSYPQSKTVWMSNDMPWIFQVFELGGMPRKKHLPFKFPRAAALLKEKALESKIINKIDQVVVLDNRNKGLFEKYLHVSPLVVRSGLDNQKFKPKIIKNNKRFTILGTGIFFRYRRFEDIIKAVALLKQKGVAVQLNIIGSDQYDPKYGQELKTLVEDLSINSQVNFLGRVNEAELLKQYRQADAFVFPNHNQTWGLAVFEAMASGTPVLVSKTAGAHEVLTDKQNALFIKPLDPDDIAAKLSMLYNDINLRHQMAKNGLVFVRENISWNKYADQMYKIFENLLAGSKDV